MNPLRFLPFFIFLFLCLSASAQSLRGTILDKDTGEAIPYATVQIGLGKGTIANEEGVFGLNLNYTATDSLLISSMGYKQKRILASSLTDGVIIYMVPSTIELSEVLLRNRMPTAEEIIREVRAALPTNYAAEEQKYQMFYRATNYMNFNDLEVEIKKATAIPKSQVAKASKQLDSLAKAIMASRLIEFQDYSGSILLKDKDSSKIVIDRATKLIDSRKDFSLDNVQEKAQNIILQYLDTTLTYKLKTGLFKIEDSLNFDQDDFDNDKKLVFGNKEVKSSLLRTLKTSQWFEFSFLDKILNTDSYRFSLDGASYFQDNPIYVVSFRPRRSKSKFSGKLYISSYDFAVLKADYAFSEGKEGKKFNMKLLLGVKFVENKNEGTILYKQNPGGTYHPYYIKRDFGNYVYLSRPLKFIENSEEREKVIFDFTFEGEGREKKELLILSSGPLDMMEFTKLEEPKTIPYTLLEQYEASVWENSQIIEPLEEMKNFKVSN
ncbi:carboxypeptidase-like regulatory domain-containing protein [Muriicola soli]|uniref:carboxypeptidase-like regulatory domain-containing protein n=1 Tax=Muriicola soli TaxID=2507538 RepID=UPI0013ED0EC2|nr:carboxypeptidase-like regulatory domain-containing protein [Muriicola soli]